MRRGQKMKLLLDKLNVQKWRCIWCDKRISPYRDAADPLRATIEHLKPRSQGGDNRWHNIAAACRACNTQRGAAVAPPGAVKPAAMEHARRAAALLQRIGK